MSAVFFARKTLLDGMTVVPHMDRWRVVSYDNGTQVLPSLDQDEVTFDTEAEARAFVAGCRWWQVDLEAEGEET